MAQAASTPTGRSSLTLKDPVSTFFLDIPLLQESPYVSALKIARRLWIYVDAVKIAVDFFSARDNACALLRATVHFFIFLGHILYWSGTGLPNSFHRRFLSDIPLAPGLLEGEITMFESMNFSLSFGEVSGVVGDADISFIQGILDRDFVLKTNGKTGFVSERLP
jgi:hypothetical protein